MLVLVLVFVFVFVCKCVCVCMRTMIKTWVESQSVDSLFECSYDVCH